MHRAAGAELDEKALGDVGIPTQAGVDFVYAAGRGRDGRAGMDPRPQDFLDKAACAAGAERIEEQCSGGEDPVFLI